MHNPVSKNKKVEGFIALLEFAPNDFLDRAISKLKEYREFNIEYMIRILPMQKHR